MSEEGDNTGGSYLTPKVEYQPILERVLITEPYHTGCVSVRMADVPHLIAKLETMQDRHKGE